MKRRAGNATGVEPAYANVQLLITKDVWLAWAIPEYERFQANHPDMSPCVSRFEDTGHYELDNIEIISVAENRARQKAILLLKPDGTKLCSMCREIKNGAMFAKSRRRPDGLSHQCRRCRSDYYKRRR